MSKHAYVFTDYHADGDRPYRGILRRPSDDTEARFCNVIKSVCADAGIVDGDEFTITVTKTGRRPFGNRRVVLVSPHTYERESLASEGDR